MEKYYLDKALNTARDMLHAYFDDKDINGVLKHLSDENFTFMGVTKDAVFNSREKYLEYAESFFQYIDTYVLIDEKYSVLSESQDSCLVLVQLKSIDTLTKNICDMDYYFYLKQVGNRLICPHFHVSRPSKANQLIESVFFNENPPRRNIPSEIESYNDNFLELMNSEAVAEKSFYYERQFPYRIVNLNYMKLLGYKTIHEFIDKETTSSLAHISAADKVCYMKYLARHYENNVAGNEFEEQYKYRSTYYVKYHLRSPKLAEAVEVMEWGNFFTQNGRTIVNCFVVNMNEVDKIFDGNKKSDLSRAECGMRIGRLIYYPRTRKIKIEGKVTELTPIENEIFLVLVDNLNQPIMPDKIYVMIRNNSEVQVMGNVLPMHISNIRRKLRESDDSIKLVYVKCKGYCLKA